jgi:hypothetical protein
MEITRIGFGSWAIGGSGWRASLPAWGPELCEAGRVPGRADEE